MSNNQERVLGRVLASEELQMVGGGTTAPSQDNTDCMVDTLAQQDFTNGGLDDDFDPEN